jgi:hypothetical protein
VRSACTTGFMAIFFLAMTGCVSTGASNIYFLGLDHHASPTPRTVEGNMNYVAYSREYEKEEWGFENGVNTYEDSYGQQSYTIFSRVSHDRYRTKYVVPVVSFNCSYKGKNYTSDDMKLLCTPPVSFRIGADRGFFTYITAVPKLGNLTNGFIMAEFGYRFRKKSD